jgi:hypothetical protein
MVEKRGYNARVSAAAELSPRKRIWLVRAAWILSLLFLLVRGLAYQIRKDALAWAGVLLLLGLAEILVGKSLGEKPEETSSRHDLVTYGFVILVPVCFFVALALTFIYMWVTIFTDWPK